MKIAICEDEKLFADTIASYINEWAALNSIEVKIFIYINAEAYLNDWSINEKFDMIFLDIIMGNISGMDLAETIRRTDKDIAIVFTTNSNELVYKGYEVNALHFLVKPVLKEDCFKCLHRAYQNIKVKKYFIVNNDGISIKISTTEIIYITMYSHNATLTTANKQYTFRKTISQILSELNDDLFVKCHKSYIVNIRHVESVANKYALMSNGSKIPLSRGTATIINEMFAKYNKNKV